MLYEFIVLNREEIIRRCRAKVATRSVPLPTDSELDHGVPLFLNQVADALRLGQSTSPEIASGATLHGRDLLRRGFTVSQVVHDYGDVCQSITDLAVETNAPVSFKCYLYVPGRKRMTQFVEDHGRGVDIKTFRLTGGEALLGETLYLRAEEVNGSRILNYRVVVQR